MPGFVDNPFRYMAHASVTALSSEYEGLPGVLIQAMACGCPVVSTDCPGGSREILGGGRYQITLENGQVVTAQLSGRMRRFRIRVIPGDRVQVGVSPYDPTHGFVTFRLREGQNAPR